MYKHECKSRQSTRRAQQHLQHRQHEVEVGSNIRSDDGDSHNEHTLARSATIDLSAAESYAPGDFSIEAFGEIDVDIDVDLDEGEDEPAGSVQDTGVEQQQQPWPLFGQVWAGAEADSAGRDCRHVLPARRSGVGVVATRSSFGKSGRAAAAAAAAVAVPASSATAGDAKMGGRGVLSVRLASAGDVDIDGGVGCVQAVSATAVATRMDNNNDNRELQSAMLMMRLQRRFEDMMLVSRVAT